MILKPQDLLRALSLFHKRTHSQQQIVSHDEVAIQLKLQELQDDVLLQPPSHHQKEMVIVPEMYIL